MYKLVLAGGAALLIAACASTQPASKSSSGAAQNLQSPVLIYKGTAEDNQQQLICSTHYPMDSHIPQRICLTKAQMEAQHKASQQAMQDAQQQSRMSGCGQPVCMRP